MKKIIALLIAGLMVLSFAACKPDAGNENTDETTTAGDLTAAATFAEVFKAEAVKEGATTNTIATALSTNGAAPFMTDVVDMEEGFLAGFTSDITGFKACTAFMPMIGSIAFVSYVFELEEGADKDAFVKTLEDNHDLRWNICVAAEEMLTATEGNFVFFIMAPLSFEQPEEDTEGEVEGGDIGGMEGELDGPAAYDPEADTTAEETTAA